MLLPFKLHGNGCEVVICPRRTDGAGVAAIDATRSGREDGVEYLLDKGGGVLIRLDRSIPFVRATLDGIFPEAASILKDAESRHGIQWLAIPENRPENNSDEWYQAHLWPFLSETHMVLAAGDLQATGCSLLDTDGVEHFPTWRYWGEIVAGWANQFWFPRPAGQGRTKWYRSKRRWQYLDFYDHGYLSGVIEGYDDWRFAVWRVLSLTGEGNIPAEPDDATDGLATNIRD